MYVPTECKTVRNQMPLLGLNPAASTVTNTRAFTVTNIHAYALNVLREMSLRLVSVKLT